MFEKLLRGLAVASVAMTSMPTVSIAQGAQVIQGGQIVQGGRVVQGGQVFQGAQVLQGVSYTPSGACYDPRTDGPVNANALQLCEDYLRLAEDGQRYETLRTEELARTEPCPTGNCGPEARYENVKEFYLRDGAAINSTPVEEAVFIEQQPVVLRQEPVVIQRIEPAVLRSSAPVITKGPPVITGGETAALASEGLAAAGPLIAAGVGVAALAGLIWAVSDDDDDNAVPTTR